jgi:hypothetical protein
VGENGDGRLRMVQPVNGRKLHYVGTDHLALTEHELKQANDGGWLADRVKAFFLDPVMVLD